LRARLHQRKREQENSQARATGTSISDK
jgi:hypothetical protein